MTNGQVGFEFCHGIDKISDRWAENAIEVVPPVAPFAGQSGQEILNWRFDRMSPDSPIIPPGFLKNGFIRGVCLFRCKRIKDEDVIPRCRQGVGILSHPGIRARLFRGHDGNSATHAVRRCRNIRARVRAFHPNRLVKALLSALMAFGFWMSGVGSSLS